MIRLNNNSMKEKYELLKKQIEALVTGEKNEVSVLANVAAAMHETFPDRYFWVGFYLVKDGELQLGPFQGSVACMHIAKGKGVCGTAWAEDRTIVVEDVEQFPGHIACSSLSKSEIVVPMHHHGEVWGVLDIDSTEIGTFNEVDAEELKKIVSIL